MPTYANEEEKHLILSNLAEHSIRMLTYADVC
jgi:hypothetical protein